MKSAIEKLAYKLCSTEVKMLIDKIEENPQLLSIKHAVLARGVVDLAHNGIYSFVDRVAIGTMTKRIYRQNTRAAIVAAIFEGNVREQAEQAGAEAYIPGEVIGQRQYTNTIGVNDITKYAQAILKDEMSKSYRDMKEGV